MTVVPAQVAGVPEIAVATPARTYLAQPVLRYTLARLGVNEIWGVGGAHAVAALGLRHRVGAQGRRHRGSGQRLGRRRRSGRSPESSRSTA